MPMMMTGCVIKRSYYNITKDPDVYVYYICTRPEYKVYSYTICVWDRISINRYRAGDETPLAHGGIQVYIMVNALLHRYTMHEALLQIDVEK